MERSRLQQILLSIWPTIYRAVNEAFYFLINLIKKTLRVAMEQIKHG